MTKRMIAGGTGFIGHALVNHWQNQDIELLILGRDKGKIQQCYGDKVTAIDWDNFRQNASSLLSDCDAVINLCGANIGDKRWTESRRQEILDSRVKTTETIAAACAELDKKAPRLLNASAIGVYGLQREVAGNLPPAFDESSDVSGSATDFLSEVGRAWEHATAVAEKAGINVVKMRFAVVLDKSGGALPQIARPFQWFVGGRIAQGRQPFSWITLHDLCRAIDFLLQHPEVEGPVNCVALQAVKQRELACILGRVLHRPSFIPMPGFVLRLLLGERATELLLKGQHVVPTRLSELGFHFDYPDLRSALKAIYG